MSTGPRIQFMRFLSLNSTKLQPWREHSRRVAGQPLPIPPVATVRRIDDRSVIVWNLVSANNRVLARSAQVFSTKEEGGGAALASTVRSAEIRIRPVVDEVRGMYGWFGEMDDESLMTCARWYSTERDRRNSIELALQSLPLAAINPVARLVYPELA